MVWYGIVLHCIALYCTLHCIVLYCIVLYCIVGVVTQYPETRDQYVRRNRFWRESLLSGGRKKLIKILTC